MRSWNASGRASGRTRRGGGARRGRCLRSASSRAAHRWAFRFSPRLSSRRCFATSLCRSPNAELRPNALWGTALGFCAHPQRFSGISVWKHVFSLFLNLFEGDNPEKLFSQIYLRFSVHTGGGGGAGRPLANAAGLHGASRIRVPRRLAGLPGADGQVAPHRTSGGRGMI